MEKQSASQKNSQNKISQNQKSQAGDQVLLDLANSVGDFIRYWGFRRIHGAIWTILYLSRQAMTGAELVKKLEVSKALVSPSLVELEAWGLIVPVETDNAKAKYFRSEPDVLKVIRKVLLMREQVMIEKTKENFLALKALPASEDLDPARVKALGTMIDFAQKSLRLFVKVNNFSSNLKFCK